MGRLGLKHEFPDNRAIYTEKTFICNIPLTYLQMFCTKFHHALE